MEGVLKVDYAQDKVKGGTDVISFLAETGIFASKAINSAGNDGLLYGGTSFFLHQLLGCIIVVAFALIMSFILFKVVDIISPMRVSEEDELLGLDTTQHDESL